MNADSPREALAISHITILYRRLLGSKLLIGTTRQDIPKKKLKATAKVYPTTIRNSIIIRISSLLAPILLYLYNGVLLPIRLQL